MEWLEVGIVVQNECLSIKSRIEALDGDRQSLVNERCFAAVTGDVADSSAEVIKNWYADSFTGPSVSTAIGRNVCVVEISAYFSHFLAAASSATSTHPRAAAAR